MSNFNENVAGQFSLGDTLGTTFNILMKRFIPLNLIVLIFQLPMLIWSVSSGLFTASVENPEIVLSTYSNQFVWIMIVSTILSFASAAAVVYGVFLDITGRDISIGECLSKSLSVLVPVILSGLLAYVIILLGTVLLVVPGIFAAICFFVVIPVVVVERPGIFASLGRSADLTKGNRWSILGLFLVIMLIAIVLGFISNFITIFFVGTSLNVIAIVISTVVQVITTTFFLIVGAVTYNNLRNSKEGVSSGEIAAVFD
ncbi:hypothetical protein WH95_10715 [Kiloniella litopenaei]|uniref:DUF7847 domain-containing protein n=1 Tax=Kiloniella litopenaei TaxID=1549748 RepID=A0A0M2RA67_9PROT|nr:hypothetical protein [Kiloniella litopenaei]KKJ76890.1 hypothetical protein WH95_10715 [Kiloniella litopenaei]